MTTLTYIWTPAKTEVRDDNNNLLWTITRDATLGGFIAKSELSPYPGIAYTLPSGVQRGFYSCEACKTACLSIWQEINS